MNTRNEFLKAMKEAVQEYIDNFYRFDSQNSIIAKRQLDSTFNIDLMVSVTRG